MDTMAKGGFDQYAFNDAFYQYDNQSIEQSLSSQDAIVRLFAILDRRVGKELLKSYYQV